MSKNSWLPTCASVRRSNTSLETAVDTDAENLLIKSEKMLSYNNYMCTCLNYFPLLSCLQMPQYLACPPDLQMTGLAVLEGSTRRLVLTAEAARAVAALSELLLFDRAKSVLADATMTMRRFIYTKYFLTYTGFQIEISKFRTHGIFTKKFMGHSVLNPLKL
jgi:hypothetical protein